MRTRERPLRRPPAMVEKPRVVSADRAAAGAFLRGTCCPWSFLRKPNPLLLRRSGFVGGVDLLEGFAAFAAAC